MGRAESRGAGADSFYLVLLVVAQLKTLANPDDILKVAARHLPSTLTNTDDMAEDLAIHRQACIYGSGSSLPISCPGLKAVQPCRVFNHY